MPLTYDESAALCVTCGTRYSPSLCITTRCSTRMDVRHYLPTGSR